MTVLGIDSVGTGLFLPIALLYLVRVVGLPLSTAGGFSAAATLVSLVVPAAVGALVDRVGARAVLIFAFAVQSVGMTGQLFVRDAGWAFAAVLCTLLGQRAFWASVFTLLAELAGDEAREPTFALAGTMQAAGYAAGAATGAVLIGVGSTGVFRWLIGANAVSFVIGTVLLVAGVRTPRTAAVRQPGEPVGYRAVLADRRFLMVLAAYCTLPLGVNLGTIAEPLYLVQKLALPTWIPGVIGMAVTVCTSTFRRRAVRRVRDWNRLRTLRAAAACEGVFFLGMAGLAGVPGGVRPAVLPLIIGFYIAAQMVHVSVGNALFEAMAPAGAKGRYIAVSQYCWGLSSIAASGAVSLLQVSAALPWLLAAGVAAGSTALFGRLAVRVPAETAYRPDAVPVAG